MSAPGLTGLIAGVAGVAWPVLLVDAGTFLVSVALVLRVTPSLGIPEAMATAAGAAAARSRSLGGAVMDGLRIVGGSRPLVAAIGGISVTMLGMGAINVLFVPFLVRDLGASPIWAGPLEAAQTISMVLAGGLVAGLASRLSVPRLFCGGIAGMALCVGLLALAPGPWAVLLIMFAVGWFVMPVQATTMTIVQQATTDATRGRVAGALNAAIQAASIGSMAVAGIVAEATGIRVVFALGAAVAALAAVLSWALFRGVPAGRRRLAGVRVERFRVERRPRRAMPHRLCRRPRLRPPDRESNRRRPLGRRRFAVSVMVRGPEPSWSASPRRSCPATR